MNYKMSMYEKPATCLFPLLPGRDKCPDRYADLRSRWQFSG
ncbi:hypothetical protein HMPREF0201_04059 [Cedecea davisae DSM 4568]|uniref:Uncharacterized protein n=1 Tax=Cedecea davisae DSM 4568 TaxID=566551 RepID=S3IMZ0_9ENTR|nr:hypothetical protein HMPREF0201_04059 [Cedecea davisae DSM 4568]